MDAEAFFTRRLFMGGGLGAAALAVAGCGFDDDGGGGGDDTGNGDSGDGNGLGPAGSVTIHLMGNSVDSLDPHYVNDSQKIVSAALSEGLVMADTNSIDVIPGAAESWEVSEDGITYTFKLREGNVWSNGEPVLASDVEWTYQRLLSPTGAGSVGTVGASSYLPAIGIKGATDYLNGATDDWESVGVKALDDSTVEITLAAPNPDFLILMSHHSMCILPQATVEGNEQAWMEPDNWVGNGPYLPTRWEPTTMLRLEPNPEYWDAENVGVQTIELPIGIDGTAALASFEAGELDIISPPRETLTQREDLQQYIEEVDGNTVAYLQRMWGGHEAGLDKRVRQALSMALDREPIASLQGAAPGLTMMPGNVVPGWEESIALGQDVDAARALIEEAGLTGNMPKLRIQFNQDAPYLQVVAEQWKEAFDAEVVVDIVEAGVHTETRFQPYEDDSVLSYYGGTFGGISTMNNWINNIFGPENTMRMSLPSEAWLEYQDMQADESMEGAEKANALEAFLRENTDPEAVEFSDLAAEAPTILDDGERLQKFLEAAAIREQMGYTIPLMWIPRSLLVAERVTGVHVRPSPDVFYYKDLRLSGE